MSSSDSEPDLPPAPPSYSSGVYQAYSHSLNDRKIADSAALPGERKEESFDPPPPPPPNDSDLEEASSSAESDDDAVPPSPLSSPSSATAQSANPPRFSPPCVPPTPPIHNVSLLTKISKEDKALS